MRNLNSKELPSPRRSSQRTISFALGIAVRITAILICADAILLLMHFVSLAAPPPFHHLRVWFDLDQEHTIASWFASSQLLGAAILFLFAAWWRRFDRLERLLYAAAGSGFLFLSADEAAMIHERITEFTVRYDVVPRFRGGRGVWIFVYGAIGLGALLVFSRPLYAFLQRRRTAALLTAGGFATLVLGAVGIEAVGYYDVLKGPVQIAVEEGLELIGGSIIVCGAIVLALSVAPPARAQPRRPDGGRT